MSKQINFHKHERPLFILLTDLNIRIKPYFSICKKPTFKHRASEIKEKYNYKFINHE